MGKNPTADQKRLRKNNAISKSDPQGFFLENKTANEI